MIRLLTELQRRNVVWIALLYIASGWALLQVSKFLLDLFAAPAWIIRLMLAVLVLLFGRRPIFRRDTGRGARVWAAARVDAALSRAVNRHTSRPGT